MWKKKYLIKIKKYKFNKLTNFKFNYTFHILINLKKKKGRKSFIFLIKIHKLIFFIFIHLINLIAINSKIK